MPKYTYIAALYVFLLMLNVFYEYNVLFNT